MPATAPKKTILLVEDEPTLQRILGSVLGDAGHTVEAVGTAEAALDRLDESDVDLVLTDKNLPKMNGLELLKEIRRQEQGGRGPIGVMMVTGYPSRDSGLQALADGADGYLVKPFRSLTHAVEQVRRVLDSDLAKRRDRQRKARDIAAVLSGDARDVSGVTVAVLDVPSAIAALTKHQAVLTDVAQASVIVGASVDALVASAGANSAAALVLVDPGATFQDVVAIIDGVGAVVTDTLAGAMP